MAALYRTVTAAIKSQFRGRINVFGVLSCKYSNDVNNKINERPTWATLTDNGSVVVCWHPEPKFPYEHSKPISLFAPEFNETDSVLKVQHRLLHKYRYKRGGPSRLELQNLTFTTKYGWYPNNQKIKRRIVPRQNRDFL